MQFLMIVIRYKVLMIFLVYTFVRNHLLEK